MKNYDSYPLGPVPDLKKYKNCMTLPYRHIYNIIAILMCIFILSTQRLKMKH